MDIKKVHAVYFSPTGGTEKAVTAIAEGTGLPGERIDLTLLKNRRSFKKSFGSNELVVAGMPVYGGRIPTHLEDFFAGLKGNDTPAIAVAMYGNREYEDALIEMKVNLEERGFKVIAGGSFIGEHTYSRKVAGGRPDVKDLAIAREFGRKAIEGIDKAISGKLVVKGNYPYIAKGDDPAKAILGPVAAIALITATEDCTHCGLCVEQCPWGAITMNEALTVDYTKCLRCFRCIKVCPAGALKINDPKYHEIIAKFEEWLGPLHKEPEMFYGE